MNYQILLYAHITFGMISLFSGAVAGFAKKGGKIHVQSGKVFGVCMLLAAATAIALSLIHPSSFLLAIGLFTVYLVISGWVWVWKIPQKKKEKASIYASFFGLGIMAYMIYQALSKSNGIPVVLLVFGGILFFFSLSDLLRKSDPSKNIRTHAGRMGGAYIASFTAFAVTNFNGMVPDLVLWIGPTPIGTALIVLGIQKYYKNLGSRKRSKVEIS